MTTEEIIIEELEGIKADIARRYNELGMKASGQFEKDLEVIELSLKKYTIDASNYSEQLIRGRKPGSMPPVAAIEAWMKTKGIRAVEKKMTDRQLAFAIANKIKREGTRYFKQGGTDLIDSVITDERINAILRRISENHILDMTTRIKRILTT